MEFPTAEAQKSLASRFDLVYSERMQDWEWEVADPLRFEEFFNVYSSTALSNGEKFSLMEIIIQSIEETEDLNIFSARWKIIEPILIDNHILHHHSIMYWSCYDESSEEGMFRISKHMRSVYHLTLPSSGLPSAGADGSLRTCGAPASAEVKC